MTIELKPELAESLEAFAALLHKTPEAIVEEALLRFFAEEEQRLAEDEERAMTTFTYDEFWDGLDIG
jgi:predicted transcriptional regulator